MEGCGGLGPTLFVRKLECGEERSDKGLDYEESENGWQGVGSFL